MPAASSLTSRAFSAWLLRMALLIAAANALQAAPAFALAPGAYVSVAAGNSHICGLLATGVVQCWGFNGTGQLGNNSTTDS